VAQAVSPDIRSTFISQLLAPLSIPAERRSFAAETRREAEIAWSVAYHRFHAARVMNEHRSHLRRVAELVGRTLKVPAEEQAVKNAHLEYVAAVDQLIMTPAPHLAALRQKRKLSGVSGGRDRWSAAIAADEARLEAGR
jgi:hypothetical protein